MNLSDIKILSVYQSKPLAWYRPKPDTFIYLDRFQLNDMTINQTWQTFWVIIRPSKHTYCHPWEILTRSGWHGGMDDIFFFNCYNFSFPNHCGTPCTLPPKEPHCSRCIPSKLHYKRVVQWGLCHTSRMEKIDDHNY